MPDATHRTVIITRPAGQGAALSERLLAQGWQVLHVPALEIEFHADAQDTAQILQCLPDFDLLHFASANAIAGWMQALMQLGMGAGNKSLRPDAVIAVMGEGSRRELESRWPGHGAHVITPGAQFDAVPSALDSETLLETLDSMVSNGSVTAWDGKRALLVKGDGGRNTLADGLLARGMNVRAISVYRRLQPSLAPGMARALSAAERPVLLFTSSEGAAAFGAMLDAEPKLCGVWRDWTVLATHARVAQTARQMSCKTVQCVTPNDDAIVGAIESLT